MAVLQLITEQTRQNETTSFCFQIVIKTECEKMRERESEREREIAKEHI